MIPIVCIRILSQISSLILRGALSGATVFELAGPASSHTVCAVPLVLRRTAPSTHRRLIRSPSKLLCAVYPWPTQAAGLAP